MSGGVFVIQEDGSLVEMTESAYASEAILQELIARYPNLLAGDQIDSESPRRWLLVSRELGLASDEDAGARWALDHLFLDQDAIPTIVEVKQSSNTQIRREVVGQMLDYAANAVVYLPVEQIQSRFREGCQRTQQNPDEVLAAFLGPPGDADTFWQQVKTNLHAGQIRLLFVADTIPPELQRIVEFLNRQMMDAEVLAIEIRQFVSGKMKTLVPRVIGHTAGTIPPKRRTWDEALFFDALAGTESGEVVQVAREIFKWANTNAEIAWGKGTIGSFAVVIRGGDGTAHFPVSVYSDASIRLKFNFLRVRPPFDDLGIRGELLALANQIPGLELPPESVEGMPAIPLSKLASPQSMTAFLKVLDWCVEKVKKP